MKEIRNCQTAVGESKVCRNHCSTYHADICLGSRNLGWDPETHANKNLWILASYKAAYLTWHFFCLFSGDVGKDDLAIWDHYKTF